MFQLEILVDNGPERGEVVFKTTAYKLPSGNYDVEATCTAGHTSFKKRGDTNPYKCPYDKCGRDVR